MKAHDRTDYQSKKANASYLKDEDAPLWKKFIDEITCGDAGLAAYIQKICGYMLSGERNEQVIIFLIGDGANGKSVFLDVLSDVFGDYSGVVSAKALIDKNSGGIPNDIAALAGKRLVTLSEFPEKMPINTTTVKSITGGDKISARHLYQEWFEFKPQFQLLCAMNELPEVSHADKAYFRRVRIIPFNRTFAGAAIDKELTNKLKREADGILTWCLEGYKSYLDSGLKTTPVMDRSLQEYQRHSDPVAQFVTDCVEKF